MADKVQYRDPTPLDPNADFPELIEGIKHKKNGKDVRLAMALTLEKVYQGQAGVKPAELNTALDKLKKQNAKDLQDTKQDLDSKINRITLGVDDETITRSVTRILKEKGVI